MQELDAVGPLSGESGERASRRGWGAMAAAAVLLAAIAVWQQTGSRVTPGPVPRDTVTVSPAGPLLTRAESLAIARAVEARIAEERSARRTQGDAFADAPRLPASPTMGGTAGTGAANSDPAAGTGAAIQRMADSIRDEIQRAVFDSLARAQAATARAPSASMRVPPAPPVTGGRDGRGGRGDPDRRVYGEPRELSGAGISIRGLSPELDSLLEAMAQAGRAMRGGPLDPAEFSKRAASLGPPRRIVVTEPRPNRALADAAPYGVALADSIRHAAAATKRFVVVDRDSVRAALEKTRTIDDLAQILNADVFASVSAYRSGADSVTWQVTVRDLSAHGSFGTRSWTATPVPVRGAITGLDSLLARTVTQLHEMDRAPRRPPPDDAPGGPLSKEAFDARAANPGPPRRLIVWTPPPDRAHPELEAPGTSITDAIRKALASNSRYVVLGSDETLNVLAKTRQRDSASRMARAELMVTIRGLVQRDSVVWSLTAWDLAAHPAYEQRTVTAGRVALVAPTANADALTRAVAAALEQLDRAPRATRARP